MESLRETKDSNEISRIRSIGDHAAYVVEDILEMLRDCNVRSGKLRLKAKVLTIGAVKSRINVLLAEHDLMTPETTP